jgi:hypothetical protein
MAEKSLRANRHFISLNSGANFEGRNANPGLHSNWFSRVFFSYVYPLLKKGYSSTLEGTDMWNLSREESVDTLLEKLNKSLSNNRSLLGALYDLEKSRLITSAIFRFFGDGLTFSGPILLNWIVQWSAKKPGFTPVVDWFGDGKYYGMFLCALLFICIFLSNMFLQWNYFVRFLNCVLWLNFF